MKSRNGAAVVVLLMVCIGGLPANAQSSGSSGPPSIWTFLGIPKVTNAIYDKIANHHGKHPAFERKPPVIGIADPANLESPWEAVKVAAEVKQAEDAAPQKIKAVKYLAKIGCGCYDKKKEGAITDALVLAMDDCTESVRLATIKAISKVAEDEACEKCGMRSCCGKDIMIQLAKLAYERDETGCYLEPSEDVRTAAVEALQACCSGNGDLIIEDEFTPQDPETPLDDLERPSSDDAPPMPPEVEAAHRMNMWFAAQQSNHPDFNLETVQVAGAIDKLDVRRGLVKIRVGEQTALKVGSNVEAYHTFLFGHNSVTTLQVVSSLPGYAVTRIVNTGQPVKLAKGDRVIGWRQQLSRVQHAVAEVPRVQDEMSRVAEFVSVPAVSPHDPLRRLPIVHTGSESESLKRPARVATLVDPAPVVILEDAHPSRKMFGPAPAASLESSPPARSAAMSGRRTLPLPSIHDERINLNQPEAGDFVPTWPRAPYRVNEWITVPSNGILR